MKIGLDLRMLGGGSGISRYIQELSLNILALDKTNQYILFFNKINAEAEEFRKFGHEMVETRISHYSLAEQIRLPKVLHNHNLDLVHFPHFNVPILYRRPFVATVHDLTHSKFPGRKKSHFVHRMAYNFIISSAVRRARKIIAVSESTKNEIIGFFGIQPEKIEVIYEAAGPAYKMMDKEEAFKHVSNRFGIMAPYILYVGVWRRYKNVESLARAFDRLRDKGLGFQLVLVGSPDPFYPEIEQKVRGINHKNDLKILGKVIEPELPYLYNGASLFVLPSFAEGFGLTALEAASCGVPIACSDIPTLREVMGNGAEYFDPKNIRNMAEVMAAILSNPKKAEELANLALNRTKHFSWKKAAEETIKVYENVL